MDSRPYTYTYLHKTTSGNTYPIEIGCHPVEPASIPFDRRATTQACKDGCKLYGRNGGCPPYAPDFAKLRTSYPYGLIIYSRLFTRDYPPKVLQGNYYVRWVLVETLLSRLMTTLGHRGQEHFGGLFLSTGHCIGCRKCVFKDGFTQCANPAKRTFSMESTGILVGELIEQTLDFSLQWWKPDEPDFIPEYMTKVLLLLSTRAFDEEGIQTILPR